MIKLVFIGVVPVMGLDFQNVYKEVKALICFLNVMRFWNYQEGFVPDLSASCNQG